jgi:hypothetical protein
MEDEGNFNLDFLAKIRACSCKGNGLFCFIKLNSLAEELDKINVRLVKKE